MPLLSSIQGKITLIALSIDQSSGEAIRTYGKILQAFDPEVCFGMMVRSKDKNPTEADIAKWTLQWERLLTSTTRDIAHNPIFVVPQGGFAIQKWIQDYFVVQTAGDHAATLVSVEEVLHYAREFGRVFQFPHQSKKLKFQGGNLLMIGNRLLAGKDLVCQQGPPKPKPTCINTGEMEALLRTAFEVKDVLLVGTEKPLEVDFSGREAYQPFFHIDLFVTPAGKYHDQETVLVAEARPENVVLLGPVAPRWEEIFRNIQASLSQVATQLSLAGYRVLRNPIVLVVRTAAITTYTFNNMKVEVFGTQKRAYIPSYGGSLIPPEAQKRLHACHQACIKQLKQEGFTRVTSVEGALMALVATQRGGLHCIAKVLRRS